MVVATRTLRIAELLLHSHSFSISNIFDSFFPHQLDHARTQIGANRACTKEQQQEHRLKTYNPSLHLLSKLNLLPKIHFQFLREAFGASNTSLQAMNVHHPRACSIRCHISFHWSTFLPRYLVQASSISLSLFRYIIITRACLLFSCPVNVS